MTEYIISTKGMSNRIFKVGQTVYGKILDQKYTNRSIVYLYDKYADPNKVKPYGIISGTTKNARDNIVTELIRNKFTNSQRAIFCVTNIKGNVTITFNDIEIDNAEFKHDYSVNNFKQYNGLYYIEQYSCATVTGFYGTDSDITIPSKINNKPVIAIGNCNEFGINIGIIDYECDKRNITIEEGIKIIDDYAFTDRNIGIIKLPSTIQYIGKNSFSKCNIDEIDLKNTEVDVINDFCFSMSNIKRIVMPQYLYSIKPYAFYNTNIENLTKPSEVTKIEQNALLCCLRPEVENGSCFIDEIEKGNPRDIFENDKYGSIEVTDFEDKEFKIVAYLSAKDLVDNKFANYTSELYEEIGCMKHIYYLFDKEDKKYELEIDIYDQQEFDDDTLSYNNYIESIKCKLYQVDDFVLDRRFEYVDEEMLFNNIRLPKDNYTYNSINIKYNDLGKISMVILNDKYKYLFDDLVFGYNHGQEFKPNVEMIKFVLFDENPGEERMEKLTKEQTRYKMFQNIKED